MAQAFSKESTPAQARTITADEAAQYLRSLGLKALIFANCLRRLIITIPEANNQPSAMPAKHRTTGATVQRSFDLVRADRMALAINGPQAFNQIPQSTEDKTAAALTDEGPDTTTAARQYSLQTPGAQSVPDKCPYPGCRLCYPELEQMPATPPLSPQGDLADPSGWQIVEPDGTRTVCFAEAEAENEKPELPAPWVYPSSSASSVTMEAEETVEGATSGEATQWIPGVASASPFPESPPINNIMVTTEVHTTTSKRYVYALRIEYRYNTNIGGPNGFHQELGVLGNVVVRDIFDSLEAANKEVERLYKHFMETQGLTEMDTVQEIECLDSGDRLFVFLDDPRTFQSWSIYTDERVLR